jgi:hypothetical protein
MSGEPGGSSDPQLLRGFMGHDGEARACGTLQKALKQFLFNFF